MTDTTPAGTTARHADDEARTLSLNHSAGTGVMKHGPRTLPAENAQREDAVHAGGGVPTRLPHRSFSYYDCRVWRRPPR